MLTAASFLTATAATPFLFSFGPRLNIIPTLQYNPTTIPQAPHVCFRDTLHLSYSSRDGYRPPPYSNTPPSGPPLTSDFICPSPIGLSLTSHCKGSLLPFDTHLGSYGGTNNISSSSARVRKSSAGRNLEVWREGACQCLYVSYLHVWFRTVIWVLTGHTELLEGDQDSTASLYVPVLFAVRAYKFHHAKLRYLTLLYVPQNLPSHVFVWRGANPPMTTLYFPIQ